MGEWNFNTKQCIRALKKLGFVLANKRHGRHDKFAAPKTIYDSLTDPSQPRFIMVPRHPVLHCQNQIISELRKMGGDEFVEKFKQCL